MFYALLGAAFAVAGADKLMGNERYEDMFDDLGWSPEGMNAVAAAEVAGGLMLGLRGTRRIGAALLAGTSAAVLASEVKNHESALAGPRALLLAAALLAFVAPGKKA